LPARGSGQPRCPDCRRRRTGRRDRWNHFHDTLAERCAAAGRDDPAFVVPLALGIGYAEKWEQQHAMLAALDAKIASHDPHQS
jgi:acyl CoA:acetate/3-ketoacid CoA transferase alpha subunit